MTANASKTILSTDERAFYQENGYLVVRHPDVAALNRDLSEVLKAASLKIITHFEEATSQRSMLSQKSLKEIISWCVLHERDRRISRAFYEVYPALSEVIGLLGHPFLNRVSRELGLTHPVPATLPNIRIDRPGDVVYTTPAHQDYWDSWLSDNSIVFWHPVVPLESDMGLLKVIPKSHKLGLLPFVSHGDYLRTAHDYPEEEFFEVPMREGEILVFSQYLVHRSGYNRSQSTRVSLQIRYNDLDTMKVMTSSFTPKHSNYVQENRKKVHRNAIVA